jgi:hypothetical protein
MKADIDDMFGALKQDAARAKFFNLEHDLREIASECSSDALLELYRHDIVDFCRTVKDDESADFLKVYLQQLEDERAAVKLYHELNGSMEIEDVYVANKVQTAFNSPPQTATVKKSKTLHVAERQEMLDKLRSLAQPHFALESELRELMEGFDISLGYFNNALAWSEILADMRKWDRISWKKYRQFIRDVLRARHKQTESPRASRT